MAYLFAHRSCGRRPELPASPGEPLQAKGGCPGYEHRFD